MTFRLALLPKVTWSVLFSFVSMVVLGLADNIRGPLFPELIGYFKLSNTTGSMSFAFASGAAFFGTMCSIYFLKRIHPDSLLRASMLLMSSGLFTMGLSESFKWYIVGTILFGMGMGTTGVAQNLLLTENVSADIRARALAGLHALYGFSSLIAPFLAAHASDWFKTSQFTFLSDWRSSYYLTGFFCLIALVNIIFIRATPDFDFSHQVTTSAETNSKNRKALVMISIFFSTYVAAEILVSSRLALYLRSYFGMNLEDSSMYVTYFFIFMLIGRGIFTLKSFKLSLRHQMGLSLGLFLLCLMIGLYLHPFFLALTGLAMAPFYPLALVYISEITGVQKRKFITTAISVQSLVVISMHIGVGYLTDAYGLFAAFGVGIFLLVLALVCLYAHPEVVT